MKTHFSTYIYVACGKEAISVRHTNISKEVSCASCKKTKIYNLLKKQ